MKEFNIRLNRDSKFICVHVLTPVTLQLAISFTNSLTSFGKKLQLSRVVIDIRGVESKSSVSDKYFYAYKGAKKAGLSSSWRIALLKDVKDNSPDFLETVMLNAGYDFKIFIKEHFAIDWLKN